MNKLLKEAFWLEKAELDFWCYDVYQNPHFETWGWFYLLRAELIKRGELV